MSVQCTLYVRIFRMECKPNKKRLTLATVHFIMYMLCTMLYTTALTRDGQKEYDGIQLLILQ